MEITDLINVETIEQIKVEIKNAKGNEVFFRGIPDSEGMVVDIEVIARGNESSVAALLNKMRKNEVIIHNHPSGAVLPSRNDDEVTKHVKEACELMGFILLDHLIVAEKDYYSYREETDLI
mgnify:CR=1 FL=1